MPGTRGARGAPLPLALLLLLPGVSAFPRDPRPRSTVALSATAGYPRFVGIGASGTLGLGFQRMVRVNRTLLLAARDHIFSFELGEPGGPLRPQRHVTWEARDRGSCALRGRQQDECHNYIRVLVPRDPRTLLACGTNAFSPVCRLYQVSSLAQEGEELSGQARCPFDAKQSVVALFVDGSLYSGTVADFQASDAVIYRSPSPGSAPLRTLKYSSRWLREPHFVQALPYGPYVYFFFREVAVELSAMGKVLVARVARVCRSDRGGSARVLERRWTSFVKARLRCPLPGDTTFDFDVLEAVTPPCTLRGHPAVLALFGTQPNSIPGSAVCAFYLADVERAFEGPFAEPRPDGTWVPVPEDRVPRPRPGCCAGMGSAAGIATSTELPDETLAFAKEHPLLHRGLAPAGHRPLVTRTGPRLTQLAVAMAPRGNHTVLFLGDEDGRVLKVLVGAGHPETPEHLGGTWAPGDGGDGGDGGTEPLLLEEISLYDPERCPGPRDARRVLALELHPPGRELFVAFAGCLVRVPLSRCAHHGTCRRSCLATRDPFCVWLPRGGCVPFSPDLPNDFEQDVEGTLGITGSCQGAPTAGDEDGDEDLAHGLSAPGAPALLGCALGAFALGVLLGALLGTACRPPGVPRAPPEPPEPPPGAPPRLYPALPGPGAPPAPPRPPRSPRAGTPRGGTGGALDPPGQRLLRQPGEAGGARAPPAAGCAPRQPPPRPPPPPGPEALAGGAPMGTPWHRQQTPPAAQAHPAARGPRPALRPPLGVRVPMSPGPPPSG